MGSHGIRDRVAIVGMGCTHVRRALGPQRRRPHGAGRRRDARLGTGVEKDDIDAYWLGTAQRQLRHHAGPAARARGQAGDAASRTSARQDRRRLRQARTRSRRGAYDIAMAVGVEKVKDAGYQGLPATLPPNDGTARTLTAAAMYSMIAPAYGEKYGVSEAETARRPVAHRVQEPLQRRPQPACAVPPRGEHGDGRAGAEDGGHARRLRLRGSGRRRRGRHRRAGRGRRTVHRQAALHQGAVVRRRQRQRARATRTTTTRPSPRWSTARRTPTGRRASPIPVRNWRWPRCTTASRPPSWC